MKEKIDCPIYLYAKKVVRGRSIHFEGDLCFGRKLNTSERKGLRHIDVLSHQNYHFIQGVKNPLYYKTENSLGFRKPKYPHYFSSESELLETSVSVYIEKGYSSGLILSWEHKDPQPNRVLVLPKEFKKTEDDFLIEADQIIYNG